MAEKTGESWRPPRHVRPSTAPARLAARLRRFLDLQAASIWRDMTRLLSSTKGTLLDVGCGAQPFRPLVPDGVKYQGIDTADAKANFGYEVPETLYFAGDVWPIDSLSIDTVLCTETLEHVYDPYRVLNEAARCLRPGGNLILTVPFSARWHFIPHDYWRYTPSSLRRTLETAGFEKVVVCARGNALTVACYKVMALILPLLIPQQGVLPLRIVGMLLGLLLLPLLFLLAAIAHLSLLGDDGDDCLGYTVTAKRSGGNPGAASIQLVDRTCPLCGSAENSTCFAESTADFDVLGQFAFASRKLPEYMHHRLLLCKRCDLLYSSPIPSADYLQSAYQSAQYDSPVEARFASRTYARFLKRILPSLASRNMYLDIGTGEGSMLEEMLALGFAKVQGVEPSESPIMAAKPEIRPLIIRGMFDASRFQEGSFDLITCFQTIEHLSDPAAACRDAGRLLRPGGALVLVGHNFHALSAKLLGEKSPIFDVEHLQLFSRRSGRLLLAEAGMERITTHVLLNSYPLHYWLKLFPLPLKLKLAMIKCSKAIGVGHVSVPLAAGNIALVGFKPPGPANTGSAAQ